MKKDCIKTVSTLSAQFTKLCNVGTEESPVYLKAKALIDANMSKCPSLAYLISLQMLYGLRISEVLRIASTDVLYNGQITLRAMKGGQDRIIQPLIGIEFFLRCKENSIDPFKDYNRYWIHRYYKKNGLVISHGVGRKNSTTHSFRHVNTSMLRNDKVGKDIIKRSLGHKSENTQEHYGKSKE